MIRIYVVGWLDENLTISRISFHDCRANRLTRKFQRPPPLDLMTEQGETKEEAVAEMRSSAPFLLGEKLSKMVLDELERSPW